MPTTTPFNNLITFSRGSNATVTGPNGLIQWAPNNLLTFSEQFDNAAWTKGAGATVVANNQVAPDGSTTADTITFTAGGATEFVRAFATFTVGLVYTVSVYARRISGTPTFIFDVGNGAAISGAQPITSAWQRFSFTFTFSGANQWVDLEASAAGSISFWGAQLELGSTATTYNPTTVKNLLGFSEAFDNAAWTKAQASIVTGAQANPVNGLFNAQKLMENTATNVHRVQQGFTTTTGATYTFSCYAKAAERSWVYLYDDAANAFAYFNVANGTVGTVGAGWTSTSITSVGNGWYRISGTATEASGGAGNQLIGIAAVNGTASYTGDGNSGVYIYGAQLSDSASLDPYVPTPGAAPSSTAFYGPRFDFDPVTLQPRGLLVEEQRTNSLKQSADFAGSEWTSINLASRTNNVVAPDGATTACTIVEDNTNNIHYVLNAPTNRPTPGNVPTTQSIYLKAGTRRYVNVSLEASGNGYNATVDTVGWTITQQGLTGTGWANGSATLTATGGGWYRLTITVTPAAAVTVTLIIAGAPASSSVRQVAYVGDGSSWIVWGAQLEAGAFATSYIPTVASTVTRSADVATITGQNFAQWYGQAEGSFVMGYQTIETGLLATTGVALGFDNNLGKSLIYIGGGGDQAASFDGATIVSSGVDTTGNIAKVASAYTGSGRAISANGAATVTGTVAAGYSSASLLNIARITGGNVLNSRIQSIRFIPARAADFQLQALST